ncbi:MAG: hypothetical protein II687_07340, partial [Selenomonadaceae bacterium]|nr:hypothetical protein [Selenomonadaceae bacterium]
MGNKTKNKNRKSPNEAALLSGIALHDDHPLFGELHREERYYIEDSRKMGKHTAAYVSYTFVSHRYSRWNYYYTKWQGAIFLNKDFPLSPAQWAYTIAHCELHLAFGHFDGERMPGYEKVSEDGTKERVFSIDAKLWNAACDIYIAKFLDGIKFGQSLPNSRMHRHRRSCLRVSCRRASACPRRRRQARLPSLSFHSCTSRCVFRVRGS